MKTYAISLKQQTDRQEVLKQYFDNVEFVDAIDKVNIKRTKHLKNGEIACFLSHMKVWKMISDNANNDDWILVLEDDAKPKNDWKVKLDKALKELPKKYGVIYLGAGRKDTVKKIIDRKNIQNEFKFHENKSLGKYLEVCNPVTQTHAYLIKPSTARHFLNSIKTIELPIDLQWWIYGVDFARFKKALIVQNRIFKSTVQ